MVSGCGPTRAPTALRVCGLATLLCLTAASATAGEQLGALVSPGRLSQPHAELEGIRSCIKCHEAGQRVSTAKCLSCHTPIADRIRAKRGVHRSVQGECVTCHAEHQGAAGELRPFTTAGFDHGREAGYPLDGRHAPLAAKCESCHKTRTFLAASTACASCHTDTHKGTLGNRCETCHTTSAAFKDVSQAFDHTKAAFRLEGAHQKVACAACHKNQQFKGLAFATCDSCHRDPHTPKQAESCAACHTAASWRTRRFDHERTKFVLKGQHQTTACAACHVKPALQVTPGHATCAACHQDPHRGRFKEDCASCHNEQSFAKAPFDHATTAFPLTGKHAPATCVACHTNLTRVAARTGRPAQAATVDFGGLKRDCVSCHDDTHKGDLGASCESCHTTERFAVTTYAHRTPAPFFDGAHTPATCVQCHAPTGSAATPRAGASDCAGRPGRPGRGRRLGCRDSAHGADARPPLPTSTSSATPRTCVTCHADAHLGQVAQTCESCHSVSLAKFAVASTFDHARTKFSLGGKHASLACAKCHDTKTQAFLAGAGTAVRLIGLGTTCASCHQDVHLGQLGARCETCHSDQTFKVGTYTHQNAAQAAFFAGAHRKTACSACHTPATGAFAAGNGTAVRYAIATTCTSCHKDVHNGALGPKCADCHRLDRLAGGRLAPSTLAATRSAR